MENLNLNTDAIIDPRDAEIEALKKELANARRRADFQTEQLDQFGDAIMGVIGDKVEALAESVIGDMIDERLPVGLDDESRREDAKALIGEILAGATITMSIE